MGACTLTITGTQYCNATRTMIIVDAAWATTMMTGECGHDNSGRSKKNSKDDDENSGKLGKSNDDNDITMVTSMESRWVAKMMMITGQVQV